MEAEHVYRIVDVSYRLHEDMFRLEDLLNRFAASSTRIALMSSDTSMAALVATVLVVLPIIIAAAGISFGSGPAITSYFFVFALVLICVYQGWRAHKTRRELGFAAGEFPRVPLEKKHEYLLEVVSAWGVRSRLVDDVLLELRRKLEGAEGSEKPGLRQRIGRYEEIAQDCKRSIKWAVDMARTQLEKGLRTQEEYHEILDWAAPFIQPPETAPGS